MTSLYATDHADALADVRDAGSPVSFAFPTDDGTYAADIDFEQTATPSSVTGYAVRVKDEPRTTMPGTEQVMERVTLLFVPTTLGAEPRQDMTVAWGGHQYNVKSCNPVAPDGSSLLMRVVCAR